MTGQEPIVIVGAGPAGIAAAGVLVAAGLRPVVIDQAGTGGGQIFRRPEPQLSRTLEDLYGFDARRARRFRDDFHRLLPNIDYRPRTEVWDAKPGVLHLVDNGVVGIQRWSRLILATGAMDRVIPIPGWTAPGVYSLGGAQIALKAEASLIGRKVVFSGTGPLLYLVSYQYAKAGAEVVLLEAGRPFSDPGNLLPLASGGLGFAKGVYYMAWLRAHGVRLLTDSSPIEITHDRHGRAAGFVFRRRGVVTRLPCDAVAIGFGLQAETQIADLLGVAFHFADLQRQWLPVADAEGRASAEGVYLAGDGLSVRGSEVAALSGEAAAMALLKDIGRPRPAMFGRHRVIRRADRFRHALDRAFPFPVTAVCDLDDRAVVCRCEGVTAGAIRATASSSGETEINRIKSFCRVGMGRCQGRLCGPVAAELLAGMASENIQSVGRLRSQAPLKPLPLATLAGTR
jgi:NADPH-dependent 2,4-dienoyl-CoA reductase/sulfur reductase-like enzyme